MNNLVQQSLIEIEKNLKDLESARSQVGRMSQQTETIIKSVQEMVKNVERIKNNYASAVKHLEQSLENSRSSFDTTLNQTVKIAKNNSNEFLKTQEALVNTAISKLKSFQDKIVEAQNSIENMDLDKWFIKIIDELHEIREQQISSDRLYSNQLEKVKKMLQLQIDEQFDRLVEEQASKSEELKIKLDRAIKLQNQILWISGLGFFVLLLIFFLK